MPGILFDGLLMWCCFDSKPTSGSVGLHVHKINTHTHDLLSFLFYKCTCLKCNKIKISGVYIFVYGYLLFTKIPSWCVPQIEAAFSIALQSHVVHQPSAGAVLLYQVYLHKLCMRHTSWKSWEEEKKLEWLKEGCSWNPLQLTSFYNCCWILQLFSDHKKFATS